MGTILNWEGTSLDWKMYSKEDITLRFWRVDHLKTEPKYRGEGSIQGLDIQTQTGRTKLELLD